MAAFLPTQNQNEPVSLAYPPAKLAKIIRDQLDRRRLIPGRTPGLILVHTLLVQFLGPGASQTGRAWPARQARKFRARVMARLRRICSLLS